VSATRKNSWNLGPLFWTGDKSKPWNGTILKTPRQTNSLLERARSWSLSSSLWRRDFVDAMPREETINSEPTSGSWQKSTSVTKGFDFTRNQQNSSFSMKI
jgi:hypothetical protein